MKPRPILSGWCMSGHHHRCCHQLQAATAKRPELICACPCHFVQPNCARQERTDDQ